MDSDVNSTTRIGENGVCKDKQIMREQKRHILRGGSKQIHVMLYT